MASFEYLTTRDNPESKTALNAHNCGLTAEDNNLLARLRAPENSGNERTAKLLPPMTIEFKCAPGEDPRVVISPQHSEHTDPHAGGNAYIKIGKNHFSNAEIAAAAERGGNERFLELHPALRITDADARQFAQADPPKAPDNSGDGDTINIITGAGSRAQLFHTGPQNRKPVFIPKEAPVVVPANPTDEPIPIIPNSGRGSRAHLFSNRPEPGSDSGK